MSYKSLYFKFFKGFSLYNSRISDKYGQKCCRYNQNGQPMSPTKATETYNAIKGFLKGWKLTENCRILCRNFYFEDYPMAVQYLKEIAKIDALTTKNCPSFHVTKGELLRLELYSASLDGLSQVDFELAMRINELITDEYGLIEINDMNDYKNEVQQVRFKRESDKIQKLLKEQETTKK